MTVDALGSDFKMAISQSHQNMQPLSVQLNMNAHQTAPQEIKTFFKLHTNRPEASEKALLDLSDARISEASSISKAQQSKAFGAINDSILTVAGDQKCYSIGQIPGRHKYVTVHECRTKLTRCQVSYMFLSF